MSEEARARTAVARLEMLSHGTCRNYQGDGRGGDGVGLPAGGVRFGDVSFLSFQRRLRGCVTESDFTAVAVAAEGARRLWTNSPDPPRDSVPWQEKAAKEPGSIRAAAKVWNITPSYMHQLRARFGKAA